MIIYIHCYFNNNLDGTKWPFMCWCAIKKLLSQSLAQQLVVLVVVAAAAAAGSSVAWASVAVAIKTVVKSESE